jgi:hypothetical protein
MPIIATPERGRAPQSEESMSKHLLIVLSNATDGSDDEFNDWYTNTHLGDVLQVPGFSAARRFKLSDAQLNPDGEYPYGYLAIYEVDSDDVQAVGKALSSGASGSMYISPALDRDRTVAWFYSAITDRVESAGGKAKDE